MGIFMVCAQTIVYFRPKVVYEKYLKLLLSMMILVQLIAPLTSKGKALLEGELMEKMYEWEDFSEVWEGEEMEKEGEESGDESGDEIEIGEVQIAPIQVEVD